MCPERKAWWKPSTSLPARSPSHIDITQTSLCMCWKEASSLKWRVVAAQTVHAGEVFYESPTDVHIVSRNASETQPAKLLVFYVKAKGTPPTVLLGEAEK